MITQNLTYAMILASCSFLFGPRDIRSNEPEDSLETNSREVVGELLVGIYPYLTKEEKELLGRLFIKGSERKYIADSNKEKKRD